MRLIDLLNDNSWIKEMIEKDKQIPCPDDSCHAPVGEPCTGPPDGKVHLSRRLKRLLIERGLYDEDIH